MYEVPGIKQRTEIATPAAVGLLANPHLDYSSAPQSFTETHTMNRL